MLDVEINQQGLEKNLLISAYSTKTNFKPSRNKCFISKRKGKLIHMLEITEDCAWVKADANAIGETSKRWRFTVINVYIFRLMLLTRLITYKHANKNGRRRLGVVWETLCWGNTSVKERLNKLMCATRRIRLSSTTYCWRPAFRCQSKLVLRMEWVQ